MCNYIETLATVASMSCLHGYQSDSSRPPRMRLTTRYGGGGGEGGISILDHPRKRDFSSQNQIFQELSFFGIISHPNPPFFWGGWWEGGPVIVLLAVICAHFQSHQCSGLSEPPHRVGGTYFGRVIIFASEKNTKQKPLTFKKTRLGERGSKIEISPPLSPKGDSQPHLEGVAKKCSDSGGGREKVL